MLTDLHPVPCCNGLNERFLVTDLLAGIARFFLRLVLLLMGFAFAASLVVAAMVLASLWALRAGWARLTGRPVTPWVMRMRPQDGWNRFYRQTGAPPSNEPGPPRRDTADVTDVEVKEPRI